MGTIIKFSYPIENLVWGNVEVNAPRAQGPAMKYSKTNSLQGLAHAPNISHNQEPQTITHIGHHGHNEEKIA